nr:50S ribosomal protein L24 [Bacteroidetes bacterium endosymbiont of Geopemphigus sp.]
MKIKKGDQVIVLSGNYKGSKGEVVSVLPKKNKAFVKGVNLIKKHTKPNAQNPQGGILEKETPIDLSKIAILDPDSSRPTRIGFQIKEGKKFRIAKRSGKVLS